MKKIARTGIVFVVAALLLLSSFAFLAEGNILPYERSGTAAMADGTTISDGSTITSWIYGAQYGNNDTWNGDGSYSIATEGDDTSDNTVKEGGLDGDDIVYKVDTNGDGMPDYIADENDTFISGNVNDGVPLTFDSGAQPSMNVKINELVPQPGDGGNQYVYIHDPAGINLADWELSNHNGWSATLDSLTTHYFSADNSLYVEMDGSAPIATSADELMLSWNAAGTGVNQGNWVVMDRVEFGLQASQPDNTTLIDYPGAPASGEGLIRTTNGTDTNDCDADFTTQAETGRHVSLTTSSTTGGSVTIPGEATYDYYQGATQDLEAVADSGYAFVEWTGDNATIADTTNNATTITMDGTYTITAEFESTAAPAAPTGLWIERDMANSDVIVHWGSVADADGYRVYHSTNRYADFGTWTELTDTTNTQYTDTGAISDGNSDYYIVRAYSSGGESGNSSMGFCTEKSFTYDGSIYEKHYISLPMGYASTIQTASDVVASIDTDGTLDDSHISEVRDYNNTLQTFENQYTYSDFGGWGGDNFQINPHDGIAILISTDFTWNMNGTDSNSTDSFTYDGSIYEKHYISVPYTLKDMNGDGSLTADDVVRSIDRDGTLDDSHISEVRDYNNTLQTFENQYTYSDFGGWGGDNFQIEPGDGIAILISTDFTWNYPALQTEPVP